jgi:hypothetical protein
MSSVNEYIEKCLAECPAGAEELLLAALIKKLRPKYGPEEQFEVFDEAGLCLGYFSPSFELDFLEEHFPEAIAAIRQRDAGLPVKPLESLEEFPDWVRADIEKARQLLLNGSLPMDKTA